MKRILEKLSQERQNKLEDFTQKLESLDERLELLRDSASDSSLKSLQDRLSELKGALDSSESPAKTSFFRRTPQASEVRKDQVRFQRKILNVLDAFESILDRNEATIRDQLQALVEIARAGAELMDARDREWDALGSNHVSMIFKSMEWRVESLAAQTADANALMKRLLLLKEDLGRLHDSLKSQDPPALERISRVLQPIEDMWYAGFENRHRGSEDQIKKQQEGFVPHFQAMTERLPGGKVLDLGCGRGEFLQLLQDLDIAAEGIDINEEMVSVCREKGLNCRLGDILEVLSSQEDDGLGGIFSSQVIEHLPPADVKRLVELAYFKLSPGGCLILETINPASVFALVQTYFLDLTHQKPIHPLTLRFLLESSGFDGVEILYSSPLESERLQPLPPDSDAAVTLNQNIDKLNALLFAPSNFAAVGWKR